MSDNNEEEKVEVVVVPDRRAANPYRRPFLVLVIAICLSLLAQTFSSWLNWNVSNDTNKLVQDIDFRNSPAVQERQRVALEEVILRVDCNSRKAIEEALNDIAEENPGLLFEVNITSERCAGTDVADPEE